MLSCVSHVQLFAILWTIVHQSPLSMEFSRQEYRSGLPFPSPGYLPHPGIKSISLISPTLAVRFFTTSATQEALDHKDQPQNQVLKYNKLLVLESRSQCKWVIIVKFLQLYYMFENFHNKILRDQKPLLCFRSVEVQC